MRNETNWDGNHNLSLQWFVRRKRLEPWQFGLLLMICAAREGQLEMNTCRSVEI